MDDQPTEDKKTEDNKKPVFPSLSSDDIKLLVITFVGTVAANLITVVFVGIAIAIAHLLRDKHATLSLYILTLIITIISIAAPVSTFIVARGKLRDKLWPRDTKYRTAQKIIEWNFIISAIVLAVFALIFILFWIGLAAGIK
jgi:hypothetical protein